MNNTVRPARAADLPAILQLERATAEAPHWPEADYAAMLIPGPPNRCLLVATNDDVLLGFAAARAIAGEAELETIAVAQNCRRRGTGAALCRAVLHWCRKEGAVILRLEVRAASVAAQQLYRSLGFTVTGRRPSYYHHPVDDAILMRCLLSQPPDPEGTNHPAKV